jgi:hypothetical protein
VVSVKDNRDPVFLKTVWPCRDITLIDDERHIQSGSKYIDFDGRWRVYRMTKERVPIPLGAFQSLSAAIFQARR